MTDRGILLRLEGIHRPSRLSRLTKKPQQLYIMGNRDLLDRITIAIVGTRNTSQWGLDCAFETGSTLSRENITVVSGLAKGIDTAAHRGALKYSGSTLAVLGSGFDHIYPAENQSLAQEIKHSGLLVSQYPPESGPRRHQFLERNTIIAGLSDAVLVVDAPERSGALHTIRFAHKMGIPTFALSNPSAGIGNKKIIENGIAHPVANSEQFLEIVQQQIVPAFSQQTKGVCS